MIFKFKRKTKATKVSILNIVFSFTICIKKISYNFTKKGGKKEFLVSSSTTTAKDDIVQIHVFISAAWLLFFSPISWLYSRILFFKVLNIFMRVYF